MSTIQPPVPGYLLRDLGYVDEIEAAAAINVTPQTMAGYRKAGIGPDFAEVARKIMYSKDALARWLAAGGTRQADESLKGKATAFPYTPPPQSEIKPKPTPATRPKIKTKRRELVR